jgi:ADP-ribose pyrophosphatase YjhB (NUDIX family)
MLGNVANGVMRTPREGGLVQQRTREWRGSRLKEDIPLLGRLVVRAFQRYWRLVRSLNLSVEGCVVEEAGCVLMVRAESGGNWVLPRGNVRANENLESALRRVLRDAAGVEVNGRPQLSFFHASGQNGQTGFYLVRNWRPLPAWDGEARRFFPAKDLPDGTAGQQAERISRLLQDRTISQV